MNDPLDEFDDFPEPLRQLMRELRDNPDALGLMRALCVIPDVRDLSYDPRRARLPADSLVQLIIYDAIDNVSVRDTFVETLMRDYHPPRTE